MLVTSSTATFKLNSLSLISLVIVFLIYSFNKNSIEDRLNNFNIMTAFNQKETIAFALSCTIFVNIPIAFELALDVCLLWKNSVDDHGERLLMILYTIIPSAIQIMNRNSAIAPYLLSCLHTTQYVGCFGAVLSLCNKLVPNYFTTKKMLVVHTFFSAGCIFSMMTFGYDSLTWRDYCMFLCFCASMSIYFYIMFKWISSLSLISKRTIKHLTVNEFSCLLYLSTTTLTIILLPGIAASIYVFSWRKFTLPVVLVFIYGIVGFSLFPSCIPGRIARYSFMLSEHKAMAERESMWATLRYVSHELRSPLNVICTGTKFALEDMSLDEKSRTENLNDVFTAGQSALSILDDLESFQIMEKGEFSIYLTCRPLFDLKEIVQSQCISQACRKGVRLVYRIGQDWTSKTYPQYHAVRIDKNRILQVFRNIVGILSAYSSEGSTITVSVNHDPGCELDIESNRVIVSSKGGARIAPIPGRVGLSVSSQQPNSTLNQNLISPISPNGSGGVIEGMDIDCKDISAVGDHTVPTQNNGNYVYVADGMVIVSFTENSISIPVSFPRLKRHSKGMTSITSDLEGGGGLGLRLRISEDMVKKHGGILSVTTGPLGEGTSVQIYLPCLRLSRSNQAHRLEHRLQTSMEHSERPVLQPVKRASLSTMIGSLPPNNSRSLACEPAIFPGTPSSQPSELLVRVPTVIHPHVRLPSRDIPLDGQVCSEEKVDEYKAAAEEGFRRNGRRLLSCLSSGSDGDGGEEIREASNVEGMSIKDFDCRAESSSRDHDRDRDRDMVKSVSIDQQIARVVTGLLIRVLVVDDSELNRKVIRRAVERLGVDYVRNEILFSIDEADDGVTACASVTRAQDTQRSYDLVLMDNIMLHLNGPEAAARMREAGYTGYIAGVTGNVLEADVIHFISYGADCVLPKPLNMDRLKEILTRVVLNASV